MMMVAVTIWTCAPELFPTKIRDLGTSVVVNVGFIGGGLDSADLDRRSNLTPPPPAEE
jgi:hypothetical protein